MEDTLTSGHIGVDKSGAVEYRTESRGRDTAALVAVDLETEVETVLAKDDRVDVGGARPRRRRLCGAGIRVPATHRRRRRLSRWERGARKAPRLNRGLFLTYRMSP
jgi:hypothetical protein